MKTVQAIKALAKAVKADVRKACRAINQAALNQFAFYGVRDNHGTRILCWTLKGAESWLPYCSEHAEIVETYDLTPLVRRVQY